MAKQRYHTKAAEPAARHLRPWTGGRSTPTIVHLGPNFSQGPGGAAGAPLTLVPRRHLSVRQHPSPNLLRSRIADPSMIRFRRLPAIGFALNARQVNWGLAMHASLATFVAKCESVIAGIEGAADRVTTIAPLMQSLAVRADNFLSAEHLRSEPEHYARNAIHIAPGGDLSLFALVWLPGQWTPVHDHGCWGVVGIVRGVLEERSYMSASGDITADSDIRLKRGGVILLNPGSVSNFVPNPDHIHMSGVPEEHETCVSLHLYGRNMNSFHIYDPAAGTRRMVDVPHHESR